MPNRGRQVLLLSFNAQDLLEWWESLTQWKRLPGDSVCWAGVSSYSLVSAIWMLLLTYIFVLQELCGSKLLLHNKSPSNVNGLKQQQAYIFLTNLLSWIVWHISAPCSISLGVGGSASKMAHTWLASWQWLLAGAQLQLGAGVLFLLVEASPWAA